jgi:rhomboid protease GluP
MEPNHNPPSSDESSQFPPSETGGVRIKITLPTVQPILTYAILSVISLIFLYSTTLDPLGERLFLLDWAKINDRILYDGEYYRLLTCMFLHLNMAHLLFNGYALYLFGRDVESLFGHVRFAVIYFMGGITGSVASLLYTDAISIGASGAIFAVFSAMAVYLYRHRHFYGEGARRRLSQMAILAVINIAFGLSNNNVDNAAHIGGLLGGFVLGWFISPEFEIQRDLVEPNGVRVVDTNTPNKWMLVPVIFAAGIAASVAYAVAVLA